MAAQGFPSSNQTCQMCRKNDASVFCSCSSAPTLLCPDCSLQHQAKPPLGLHLFIPLAWLGRNPEEYASALRQLNQAKSELRGNVEVLEKCCREMPDMINRHIQKLLEYRDSLVQWLQNEKEQVSIAVETAIQEAETCLGQGVAPANPLAQAVLTAQPEQRFIMTAVILTYQRILMIGLPIGMASKTYVSRSSKVLCKETHSILLRQG